jgi:diaminohydroxyphosphoribosylaminopyrimidine deaminase/5-amino-6-(5-phosphoribosylamino)uracil reductase
MQKCLNLAYQAIGNVAPNPMVGSIIVYNNKIIGTGYHKGFGLAHAEVNAIASVKDKSLLNKSTLYVNLEPCAHTGKTPPCANMIIEHKIPKVIIGCIDTFSKVSGKGVEIMKKAGIKVIVGILENESKELNKRFFSFHEKKRPYIILKWAKSQDNFIAPYKQIKPFWMTCTKSKELVHKWRADEDAILIGRITAEKDNPSLTVRKAVGNNPIRIIIDKDLKLLKSLKLFNSEAKTFIFNELTSLKKLENNYFKINFNNVINNILKELYNQNIQSIIIEGGAITLKSFIDSNIWDEARIFSTKKELLVGVKSPDIKGLIRKEIEVGVDYLKIIENA